MYWQYNFRPGCKIRYWSKEGPKRNDPKTNALMLHTDVDFGAKYAECPKEDALEELEKIAIDTFPKCPKAEETVIHKWKYSQVLNAYADKPGYVTIGENILLVGDGYAPSSNFDGCAFSAIKATNFLANKVS